MIRPQIPKKKLAILLVNRQFIRSWIDSGLADYLIQHGNFDITFFADSEIHSRLPQSETFNTFDLGIIPITKKSKHLVAMGLVQMSSRSRTFRFKLMRQFLPETLLITKNGTMKFKVLWLLKSLGRTLKNTIHNRFTILYFFGPVRALIRWGLRILDEQPSLPSEIAEGNFEWLIIPSASAIGYTTDYLEAANKIKLKTIIAIDNWDHLTGKSIYPIKPDYFTVMGARCVEHAVNIHNCEPARVLPLGLPRFDIYRQITHEPQRAVEVNVKRVLYCGFSLAHAEKRVVSQLADYFDNKYGVGNVQVHYRPHPGPLPRFDDSKITNRNVTITEYGDLKRTAMPDMDEDFINALRDSDVVIGAPTTLILEALLMNKKCVLDLTHDGFHRTTAAISAVWHTHMIDLLEISGLQRGNTVAELQQLVDHGLHSSNDSSQLQIQHLYNSDDLPYRDQLLHFLLTAEHSKID